MTHRLTPTERAALAHASLAELLPLAQPDRRTTRAIVHDPRLAQITLQRLALVRAKAGEFCVIQEAA